MRYAVGFRQLVIPENGFFTLQPSPMLDGFHTVFDKMLLKFDLSHLARIVPGILEDEFF